VAQACNPSYSGGSDQDDHSSKLARANSSQDSILKKPFTEKGWWCGSWFWPFFKTQLFKKKKKKKELVIDSHIENQQMKTKQNKTKRTKHEAAQPSQKQPCRINEIEPHYSIQ
jgi:hypothetical protein